jgi:hypothetical protein
VNGTNIAKNYMAAHVSPYFHLLFKNSELYYIITLPCNSKIYPYKPFEVYVIKIQTMGSNYYTNETTNHTAYLPLLHE